MCCLKNVSFKKCVIFQKVCQCKKYVISNGVLTSEGVLNCTPWVAKGVLSKGV